MYLVVQVSCSLHYYFVHFCRVDHAVSRVYRLALHNFTNDRVVSSCAAFIEMLDRDSRLLRIDSQAAARIARYSPCSPSDSERE